MITMETMPAMWTKLNNQYVVKRNGYVLFGFMELTEEMRLDGASKKTFVMTSKNMDVILDMDTRAPYNEDESNEELLLYQS